MCRDQDRSSLFPISEGKFNGFKITLVIYLETRVIGKCEIHPNLQPRNKSTLRRFSLEKTCHFYPARVVKILSNDSDVNFTQRGMKITSQKLDSGEKFNQNCPEPQEFPYTRSLVLVCIAKPGR